MCVGGHQGVLGCGERNEGGVREGNEGEVVRRERVFRKATYPEPFENLVVTANSP